MAETINCNFGRTAVRAIAQNLYVQNGCVKTFPPKAMAQLMQEYQSIFKDTPSMQLSTTTSTVIKLLATFNSHWHLQEKKNDFMKTFSIAEWKKLTSVQQAGHTIKQCHTCQTQYQLLTSAFPHKQTSEKKTTITFTSDDLTSPASIGRAVISQLDPIAHQHTGQSAEQVLSTTSKLMVRPTRSEQQLQTKSIVNKVKKVMQSEMDKQTATTVMGNRISWKVYNKMRTTPLIDKNTTRKRKSETNTDDLPPPKKRTHAGNIGDMMDVPRLLEEARAWPADQVINWSEVARRYGVTKPNGGQYVKEVLATFGIIAATQNHRPQRKPRRARKVLLPGNPITDILRFFYGDGPAQQYEAGNSIGGIYPCVRCAVDTDTIVNLECAFKCQTMTLQERQRFVLEGTAWKKGGMNIYDKLKKAELTEELQVRQINTRGMNKKQMDETLRSIRAGITNLPALLQCCPTADLNTLQLGRYEVCPVEPLHDLKGHFANILEESEKLLSENALAELKKVKIAILSKSTLRCSDYRKAIILLYIKFRDNKFDKEYEELFRTAAELSHLLYSQDEKRVPKSILALHNISFLHGMICVQLFRDTAPPRMFGRYFHALISHSPLFFRLASMSALNTEDEERIFGQAKSITKSTSNYHVEQVIDNIITRVQVENALLHGTNNVDKEENSIRKLSKVAGNSFKFTLKESVIFSCLEKVFGGGIFLLV
eukprot:Em0003g17a